MNGSFYFEPEFDALLAEAASTPDVDQQMGLYADAKDMLLEDTASILLWTYSSVYVVSDRAASYVPDPYNRGMFGAVDLEQ